MNYQTYTIDALEHEKTNNIKIIDDNHRLIEQYCEKINDLKRQIFFAENDIDEIIKELEKRNLD